MSRGWAKKGFQAVEEHQKAVSSGGNFVPFFSLKDGEDAIIRFVTKEPVVIYEHYIPNAKGKRNYTCLEGTGEECPLCAAGNKPSFRGVFAVIDFRKDTWQKDGEEKNAQYQVKIMKHGIKALKAIATMDKKRGLEEYDWEIIRSGGGTDTSYSLLPEPKHDLPQEAIDKVAETDWQEKLYEELEPMPAEQLLKVLGGGSTEKKFGKFDLRKEDDDVVKL